MAEGESGKKVPLKMGEAGELAFAFFPIGHVPGHQLLEAHAVIELDEMHQFVAHQILHQRPRQVANRFVKGQYALVLKY